MQNTTLNQQSPKLPPVLSLLIAGHRMDKLSSHGSESYHNITVRMQSVIEQIRELLAKPNTFPEHFYDISAAHVLRIVTGACDGTDQAATSIATQLGLPLDLLLPDDIEPNAEQKQAERIIALAASEQGLADEKAFQLRDDIALNYADVLLVVWDGDQARGMMGGTVRLIQHAAVMRKPVIWIDTKADLHVLKLSRLDDVMLQRLQGYRVDPKSLCACFDTVDEGRVASVLAKAVLPAINPHMAVTDPAQDPSLKRLDHYFLEQDRWSLAEKLAGVSHNTFSSIAVFSPKKIRKALRLNKPHAYIGPLLEHADSAVKDRFSWSDLRANAAAGHHRDMTWLLYIFSSLTVFSAVAGAIYLWPGANGPFWVVLELLLVSAILISVFISKRQRWHHRWLSHRYIAEQLRYGYMCYPLLALPRPFYEAVWKVHHGRVALHSAELWILQRTLRTHGLPATNDRTIQRPAYAEALTAIADSIVEEIEGQVTYHQNKAHELHHLHHNLHTFSGVLFGITFICVLLHFIVHASWLLIGTAFVPALAAAIHGIVTKLELNRIATQARQTRRQLQQLIAAIRELSTEKDTCQWRHWVRLRDLALQAASVMSDENSQWQQLIQEQEVELPA